MIKMQVIGTLGKDSEVKTINNKNVINFSIAHSEKYKDKQGNQQEKTTWIECAQWTEKTSISSYLLKGAKVYVEGEPVARAWESNGEAKASLGMRVSKIEIVKFAGDKVEKEYANDEPSEDLPF